MKRFSKLINVRKTGFALSFLVLGGCSALGSGPGAEVPPGSAAAVVIEPGADRRLPPYEFSDADARLLEEVQLGCFNYLWNHCSPNTGMVYDRTSADLVSVAGVGFQLSAIPVGVERGWITREQGHARAAQIMRSLLAEPGNRVHGLFFHFLDDHARPHPEAYEHVVSTIDSALLFAGVITASEYFGGDVRTYGDELLAGADWRAFLATDAGHQAYTGFVSLGWRADDPKDPTKLGSLLSATLADAGDEHRLVAFLGVCAPNPEHRLSPDAYYGLRRSLGTHPKAGVHVWLPYSGALFTAFFAHCWIDYAHLGTDNPGAHGHPARARVNWWENSRRIVNLHRAKCAENPEGFKTLGPDAWGLSACDGPGSYLVGQLKPTPVAMPDARADWDVPPASHINTDPVWHGGILAPYAAGSSVVFEPEAAVRALRHYRSLKWADGSSLLWEDPASGGWGFFDSYTLDTDSGEPWVAEDRVAIDQGPLVLLIENARSGHVWDMFMTHPAIRAGLGRLDLVRDGD